MGESGLFCGSLKLEREVLFDACDGVCIEYRGCRFDGWMRGN